MEKLSVSHLPELRDSPIRQTTKPTGCASHPHKTAMSLAPHLRLGRIDLAQIQNVPLHHPAAVESLILDEAPIEVRLAVLPSFDSSQEHDDAC